MKLLCVNPFLGLAGCGTGGHDRVGPLGGSEGMLLLGHAGAAAGGWILVGAGRQFIHWTAPGSVGRFGGQTQPGMTQTVCGRCLNTSRAA